MVMTNLIIEYVRPRVNDIFLRTRSRCRPEKQVVKSTFGPRSARDGLG